MLKRPKRMAVPERIDALDSSDKSIPKRWRIHHVYLYNFAKKYCKRKVILDAGCGTGYGAYLLSKVSRNVVALDVASCFKRKYKASNIEFCMADAEKMPFHRQTFNVVISLEAIEHFNEPGLFVQNVYFVLKRGGTFVLSTPNKRSLQTLLKTRVFPHHVRDFYLTDVLKLLNRSGFKVVKTLGGGPLVMKPLTLLIGLLMKVSAWFGLFGCWLGRILPEQSTNLLIISRKPIENAERYTQRFAQRDLE